MITVTYTESPELQELPRCLDGICEGDWVFVVAQDRLDTAARFDPHGCLGLVIRVRDGGSESQWGLPANYTVRVEGDPDMDTAWEFSRDEIIWAPSRLMAGYTDEG